MAEAPIDRAEVLVIMGALADILADVREIKAFLWGEDEAEEEDESL